jgi:hypothetical protein
MAEASTDGKSEKSPRQSSPEKKKPKVKDKRQSRVCISQSDVIKSEKRKKSKTSLPDIDSKWHTDDLDQLAKDVGAHDYQIVSLLGVGSQGRVYLVKLINSELYFAMKVFKKIRILPNEKVGYTS